MDLPIVLDEKTVGNCTLLEQGLYWSVEASCVLLSDRVERLYCGNRRLGVLERNGNRLYLKRLVSKSSFPELPPQSGALSLRPAETAVPWRGSILGCDLNGFLLGDSVWIPYEADSPCPCEPLFCFCEIKNGFWKLPLMKDD